MVLTQRLCSITIASLVSPYKSFLLGRCHQFPLTLGLGYLLVLPLWPELTVLLQCCYCTDGQARDDPLPCAGRDHQ